MSRPTRRRAWWSDAASTLLVAALPMALLIAALAAAAVGVHPDPQVPPVVVDYTACGPDGAYVNVTNPGDQPVQVGFNADPASDVEPGGSVGAGISVRPVQVVVDGEPYGVPHQPTPSDCIA